MPIWAESATAGDIVPDAWGTGGQADPTSPHFVAPENGLPVIAVCLCGGPMPPRKATGRPRHTCSPRCATTRDRLLRLVSRRDGWIAAWRAEAFAGSHYPPETVRRELAQLQAEQTALLQQLAGIHPNHQRGA